MIASGRHLLQRFFKRLVAAVLQKHIDFRGAFDAPALADDRNLALFAFVQRAGNHRLPGLAACRCPAIQ